MNRKRKSNFNFTMAIEYLFIFFLFLCFNKIEKDVYPYSVAILVCVVGMGASSILSSLLFLASFLVLGRIGLLPAMSIVAIFYCVLNLIYKRNKIKGGFLYSALSLIAMLGYIVLGDTNVFIALEKRLSVCFFTTVFSFLALNSGLAVSKKGIKYKLAYDEYASIIAITVVLGLGICNFASPYCWKAFCVFATLICCYLFKIGIGSLISSVLGISISVYYGNVALISVFLVWGIIAQSLMPVNKFISALSIPVVDCLLQLIFSVYNGYYVQDFLVVILSAVAFCCIPTKSLKSLKDKLFYFKEKQLARESINRNKIMTSNRLYELSGVFTEMADAFRSFTKKEMSLDCAKALIIKQTLYSVCENCDKRQACAKNKGTTHLELERMIDIGFAKGKLSLIDLPSNLGKVCVKPSELLYSINKLLADYRNYTLEKKNMNVGRDLLAMEAEGVSQILKSLALDTGSLLKFQNNLERVLVDNLFKNGISVSELLVHGENERVSISMIINSLEYSILGIIKVLSKTLGKQMVLYDKANVTEDKIYLVFKYQSPYDAVFGIAQEKKSGSVSSGDTHSVTKISEDKFLVALSDGMGSGKDAEKISNLALSLIESLYKAGLSGEIILNTVNKLLAINTEDTFTALDVSVIDLKSCNADFIKYGSPYGFIIGENGVKIIEGNTLPLGIIDELKPSVCHTNISNDNMILLVTDGISDAFGCSEEIIDFLTSVPALNPQSLADAILKKALELNGNKANDDMTALAVRVFKKTSNE